MRKSFIFCVLLFLIVSQGSAFAQEQAVLGVETQPAVMPSIPPTSEGPGLLLPDSPFFFLDKLKQNGLSGRRSPGPSEVGGIEGITAGCVSTPKTACSWANADPWETIRKSNTQKIKLFLI